MAPLVAAAAISAAGSLVGKLFNKGSNKINKEELEANKGLEKNYYYGLAHMDQLQSSENQAALRQAREYLKLNNKSAERAAAVTGATDESLALQKAAGTDALANTTAQIAANSTNRSDTAMNNYIQANRHYTDAISGVRTSSDVAQTQATSGLLAAGINAAATYFANKK